MFMNYTGLTELWNCYQKEVIKIGHYVMIHEYIHIKPLDLCY